jgi:hypothetical protein
MTALAQDRNTSQLIGDVLSASVAAAVLIYGGSIVMRNSAGDVTKGQTALGLIGVGIAMQRVDNSDGAAGDETIKIGTGVFKMANSASADAITAPTSASPATRSTTRRWRRPTA